MQKDINFITTPIKNQKGFNQYVKILAIQDKTFQYRLFISMSECGKALGVDIREISRISLGRLYTCANGWTFIRANDKTNLNEEINYFKTKRDSLNISILADKRVCCKCKIEKPLNNKYFHKGKSNSKYACLRFKTICIECRKGEHKKLYEKTKIKIANNDNLRAKNILLVYNKIDKKKGMDFDLSIEWIKDNIINANCSYCGFSENIGIDRVENSIGHIKSNCIPCCKSCNSSRMDNFSYEEFKIIGLVIREIKLKRIKKDNPDKP